MDQFFFPKFIQEPYRRLMEEGIGSKEKAEWISRLLESVIGFLGRLCILEYAQATPKSEAMNHLLFGYVDKKVSLKETWFLIRTLLNHLVDQKSKPVILPLLQMREKYPSLQLENMEDRVTRLIGFYDSINRYEIYLASLADIQEAEEQIATWMGEIDLLKGISCKGNDTGSLLIYQNKGLWVDPFFTARPDVEDGIPLYETKYGLNSLEKVFKYWFPDDFEKYQDKKNGIIDFAPFFQEHRENYTLLPWIEAELEEAFSMLPDSISLGMNNIVLVEGYPGTGKSALAANLSRVVGNGKWADFVWLYSVAHGLKNATTFEKWLIEEATRAVNLSDHTQPQSLQPKIVVAIDAFESAPKEEQRLFLDVLKKPLFRNMGFVVFKRVNELPPFEAIKRITLSPQDNLRFESCFSKTYVTELTRRYATSFLSRDILKIFSRAPGRYLSVQEIASELNLFSPEVLKKILPMLPLLKTLEIREESEPVRYCLFHPVLANIVAY